LKKFRSTLADSDYSTLENCLLQRQELLDSFKWSKSGYTLKNGHALFSYANKTTVQNGGRLRGVLFAPFNWDIRWLKEKKVKPAGRSIKVNDPQGQYLIPGHYLVDMVPYHKEKTVRIFCRADKEALKVIFIRSNSDYQKMANSQISVIAGPDRKNLQRFYGRFRNKSTPARYTKQLDNAANKGQGDRYVNQGSAGKVTVPAPGVQLAPGEISAELTIPFKVFGKVPQPGDEWLFNVTADHTRPGVNCYFIWEHNFEQTTWRNTVDRQGKIKF
jgi:hypothetical protein